jgi:hypothetical protein
MANTYEIIASVTVGSGGAANIEFTSIPATYTDLVVLFSARTDRSGSYRDLIKLQPNSSSADGSERHIINDGGTLESGSDSFIAAGVATASSSTANTFSNNIIYIPNYASSNYKSLSVDAVPEENGTQTYMFLSAGLWSSSSAITSLKLVPNIGPNFVQYSTAYLYGISNA